MRSKIVIEEPAESKNLTVLPTVKAELGITTDEHDAVLEGFICQASDIVASYCDRVFARETVTEHFWPERRSFYENWDSLVLSRTPVEEIISVTHDNSVLVTGDYEIDSNAGILYRMTALSVFDWCVHTAVEVQYTGGYLLLDDLPRGIERATILLVKDAFFARSRDPRIKTESTPSIYSVDYWIGATGTAGDLPPDVIALLAPYRRLHA
jgi:gp6-like head-tail connector protein